jgi:hypothetical protein
MSGGLRERLNECVCQWVKPPNARELAALVIRSQTDPPPGSVTMPRSLMRLGGTVDRATKW